MKIVKQSVIKAKGWEMPTGEYSGIMLWTNSYGKITDALKYRKGVYCKYSKLNRIKERSKRILLATKGTEFEEEVLSQILGSK